MTCHEDADEPSTEHGDDDHEAPAASRPVEKGTDDRRDHGEGRHGEDEVEEHLRSSGADADIEEERPRQGDGDEDVARDAHGVREREARERRKRGRLEARANVRPTILRR